PSELPGSSAGLFAACIPPERPALSAAGAPEAPDVHAASVSPHAASTTALLALAPPPRPLLALPPPPRTLLALAPPPRTLLALAPPPRTLLALAPPPRPRARLAAFTGHLPTFRARPVTRWPGIPRPGPRSRSSGGRALPGPPTLAPPPGRAVR